MNISEAKPGMRVIVNQRLQGRHTNNTQGWNEEMNVYIGTQQTIKVINASNIQFEDGMYYWDPRDVDMLDGIKEPISPNGKKVIFDVSELG